jgi:hypothetical protein
MKSELVHNSGTKQGAQNPDLLKLVSFFGAFDLGLCAKKNCHSTMLAFDQFALADDWEHGLRVGTVA